MFLEYASFDKILHGNFFKQFQVVVIPVFAVLLTFPFVNILSHEIADYILFEIKMKKKKKIKK